MYNIYMRLQGSQVYTKNLKMLFELPEIQSGW